MARKENEAASPEAGSRWRLVGNVPGENAPHAGMVVAVREVVSAAEPGASAFSAEGLARNDEMVELCARQREEWANAGGKSDKTVVGASRLRGETPGNLDEIAHRYTAEYRALTDPFQIDAVVIEWDVPGMSWDGNDWAQVAQRRAWSVGIDQFPILFEEVAG